MVNSVLRFVDAEIVKRSELKRMVGARRDSPSFAKGPLPEGAAEYLRVDNPRLVELREHYRGAQEPALRHSQWKQQFVNNEIDLQHFRGDNAYLWTFRGVNSELSYLLTTYYVERTDHLGLLGRLEEDGLFGAHIFRFNDRLTVSSDLLNSLIEIDFLERHLGLSRSPGLNVLDIGAGYGRLAHRTVRAIPQIGTYFCVDAIPESTFLSEYYLRFRGVDRQGVVVPFTRIEQVMARNRIDLAVNVHSFSECNLSAIEWWLDLLQRHQVKQLMIVPNAGRHGGTKLESIEADGSHSDFLTSILDRGYRLVTREPKYLDPSVQQYGVSPTYHHLFRLVS